MASLDPKVPDDYGPARKTCKRYNELGHAHALTFTCYRRQPFLSRERSCHWFVDGVDRARAKHGFDLWAYCLMPEHVHLLLWPTLPAYSVSDILNSIKQSVAKRALIFVQREARDFLARMEDRQPSGKTCYRFWQRGGGYDRNLFEPGTVYQQMQYLHANPVRRGLCARAEDWLWSSAADYAGVRAGPLALQRESLPGIGEFA